jgi:Zn-finger protein
MAILTMTTIPFYRIEWSRLTDISTISTKTIWNCKDCHDQIRLDHFDHENFIILGMVMVKIGLTILTLEPRFWPNG